MIRVIDLLPQTGDGGLVDPRLDAAVLQIMFAWSTYCIWIGRGAIDQDYLQLCAVTIHKQLVIELPDEADAIYRQFLYLLQRLSDLAPKPRAEFHHILELVYNAIAEVGHEGFLLRTAAMNREFGFEG
jgi:hypothetical protein